MLQVYDRVVTSGSEETLLMLTMILVFIFIFLFLLDLIRNRIALRVSNKFDDILKNDTFKGLFQTSLANPAQTNTKALKDIAQVRQFISSPALMAFFDIPWTIAYVALLFAFHAWYGYFAVGSIVILICIILIKEKSTKEKQEEVKQIHAKEFETTQSYVENSEVIHAMGMLPQIHNMYDDIHNKWVVANTQATDSSTTWSTMTKYLRMLFQSLILGVGAYLVINMELTGGMIIAGSLILGRVLAPLDILTNQWKLVVLTRKSFSDLKEFASNLPDTSVEPIDLPSPLGEVSLENIIVIPPKSKQAVLKHISLTFKKGEVTALIGESASGKSSLIRSILGIWPIAAGKVMYDGVDILQWDREKLGQFIGYLPQDIELFEGTVAQNISRMKDADSATVIEAATLCDTHNLIINLPDGYNTQIGKNGISLSGGQRQRIALARAIFGNPKIIILDEPNSNLDDRGDLALVNTIQKLKEIGTTVILITHKPQIIKYTNQVVVLKNGEIHSNLTSEEFFQHLAKGLPNATSK